MRIRDLGEGALIERIRSRFGNSAAVVGIGDDAAVLDIPAGHSLVYCSDLVAENTHFLRTFHPADSVGYKAVAVNVSDVGAMGGVPLYFTISLAAPNDLELAWLDGFYDGVERACRDFGVHLAGGDLSSAATIFVDVSMIGSVPAGGAVRRAGARVGDRVYVTGALGASALGLRMLRQGNRAHPAVERHLYPQPRHRVGAAIAGRAHAMIDISDGLSTDLGHILAESGVSARIDRDRLPAAPEATIADVLHGGEEYELIVTAAADLADRIEGVAITCIGEIISSSTSSNAPSGGPAGAHRILLAHDDRESVLEPEGWRHF